MRGTVKKILVIALALPLAGVSCSREGAGGFLPGQLVDKLKAQWQGAQSRIESIVVQTSENFVNNLTADGKQAVEDWLAKNKLNEYGDSKNTFYTGGTPLFDEQTGESLNRYEYLFDKFPELKDIVKNATETTQ